MHSRGSNPACLTAIFLADAQSLAVRAVFRRLPRRASHVASGHRVPLSPPSNLFWPLHVSDRRNTSLPRGLPALSCRLRDPAEESRRQSPLASYPSNACMVVRWASPASSRIARTGAYSGDGPFRPPPSTTTNHDDRVSRQPPVALTLNTVPAPLAPRLELTVARVGRVNTRQVPRRNQAHDDRGRHKRRIFVSHQVNMTAARIDKVIRVAREHR